MFLYLFQKISSYFILFEDNSSIMVMCLLKLILMSILTLESLPPGSKFEDEIDLLTNLIIIIDQKPFKCLLHFLFSITRFFSLFAINCFSYCSIWLFSADIVLVVLSLLKESDYSQFSFLCCFFGQKHFTEEAKKALSALCGH